MDRIKQTVVTASFVLIAATLGFVGTYMILSAGSRARPAAASKSQAEARASFDANLKRLDAIRAHVLAHFQSKGSYPISKVMAGTSGTLGAKFPDASAGKFGGSYLYWSETGTDYKVIAIGTGDCFMARELRGDLVDPVRSWGPMDCHAYGYWSDGAKMK